MQHARSNINFHIIIVTNKIPLTKIINIFSISQKKEVTIDNCELNIDHKLQFSNSWY